MQKIEEILKQQLSSAFRELFSADIAAGDIKLEATNQEFEGHFTFVVFPYLKLTRRNPEESAKALGEFLKEKSKEVQAFNVIKGFLNLSISDQYWMEYFVSQVQGNADYGKNTSGAGQKFMVEYSSPNTNKPIHLGHLRNIFLGYAVAEIFKWNGYDIIKSNLINDRGIHICKSMLAWMKFGNGETPESSGIKGDHLVGKYYVEFDKAFKAEVAELVNGGMSKEEAEKNATWIKEAQEMLRKWEAGDEETLRVWRMMNGWVLDGFNVSYNRMGVDFDKVYYESNTYLLGKEIVEEGLQKGVFYRKDDGSVWIDLTEEGLDQKLLLRSDGTSVYMTQDLGTADLKYDEYHMGRSVYVVGNEQEYHFKVLFTILKKLGKSYADGLFHLSYGMVDLPSGKMKSREGTVVDADDLMNEMHESAREKTEELGKIAEFSETEKDQLFEMLGLGALKYFLLKVDPHKRMLFDPNESIELQGNTGPFIQYTHARICSLLRNLEAAGVKDAAVPGEISVQESGLLLQLYKFPETIKAAAELYSPATVAMYLFDLAKAYNRFYQEVPVLKESDEQKKSLRKSMSAATAQVLRNGLAILGIRAPERM